jgi:hypothetical protein
VDCHSDSYASFRTVDGFFIVLYVAVPAIWGWLLWRQRATFAALEVSKDRTMTMKLKHLSFLYQPYRPAYYAFECVETYRRVFFIGVIPLLTQNSPRRAMIGVTLAMCSLAFFRELEPFKSRANNLLVYVAQVKT